MHFAHVWLQKVQGSGESVIQGAEESGRRDSVAGNFLSASVLN